MSASKIEKPPLRYAITDRTHYGKTEPERRRGLVTQAVRLAGEGVDYIQLREKDLFAQDLIGLAREILSAIRDSCFGTRLLINARADVALAAEAHGVHLPAGDNQLTPIQVRDIFATAHAGKPSAGVSGPTVSVSCHTLDEVRRAREEGADLILFGPVFGKSIAGRVVVPGIGLEALKAACEVAEGTPVFALGGVTAEDAAATIAVGAVGIAGIRLFH